MKYNFSTYKISKTIFYNIEVEDDNFYPITLLTFPSWTPQIIQELLSGIVSTKDSHKEFKFQTEGDDLYIFSNGYGVQFFNLKSQNNKEADLVLPHDTFIDFFKDFKKFVEENS